VVEKKTSGPRRRSVSSNSHGTVKERKRRREKEGNSLPKQTVVQNLHVYSRHERQTTRPSLPEWQEACRFLKMVWKTSSAEKTLEVHQSIQPLRRAKRSQKKKGKLGKRIEIGPNISFLRVDPSWENLGDKPRKKEMRCPRGRRFPVAGGSHGKQRIEGR